MRWRVSIFYIVGIQGKFLCSITRVIATSIKNFLYFNIHLMKTKTDGIIWMRDVGFEPGDGGKY